MVVAFSQVTVMCINYLFTLNPLLKYAILVIVLILLKYLKDGINRLVRITFYEEISDILDLHTA